MSELEGKIVKAMVFTSSHLQMWELDPKFRWAPKNLCFQTVVLEKTLRIPWTATRSNQSILKEINPDYSSEGLMLKLKLHYFGHMTWRADLLGKTLMLGKIEGKRRRGWQRMRWLDSITNPMTWISANSGRQWWTEKPGILYTVYGVAKTWTWLSGWKTLNLKNHFFPSLSLWGCPLCRVYTFLNIDKLRWK